MDDSSATERSSSACTTSMSTRRAAALGAAGIPTRTSEMVVGTGATLPGSRSGTTVPGSIRIRSARVDEITTGTGPENRSSPSALFGSSRASQIPFASSAPWKDGVDFTPDGPNRSKPTADQEPPRSIVTPPRSTATMSTRGVGPDRSSARSAPCGATSTAVRCQALPDPTTPGRAAE